MLLGVLGVLSFSLTFPATTAAEASFSPVVVGVGRAVPAAVLGAAVLLGRRQPLLPPRTALRSLLIVALTVGVGFGLLSALALRQVSSVHGAVLTGLIPAATAGMAVWRARERPRRSYWVALGAGLAVVIGFAVSQGGGRLRPADMLLLAGIAVAGVGYTEGGILAREYGGWRVISWALILALPVTRADDGRGPAREPAAPRNGGSCDRPGVRQPRLDVPGLLCLVPGPRAAAAWPGSADFSWLSPPSPSRGRRSCWASRSACSPAVQPLAVIVATAVGRRARVDRRPGSGGRAARSRGRVTRGYGGTMPDRKEIIEVAGRAVTISNPDKVYFPRTGHTKLDLVRYYLSVAEGALVGVRDRPMVLKRFVHGAEGEAFFQKRAPANKPDWLESVVLSFPSGRTAEEIVVSDAAGLAWVANLGCIDLNPHPIRAR